MSVEEIQKYRNLLESVLLEAQNYEEMFKQTIDLFSTDDDRRWAKQEVNNIVKRAKAALHKSDRIVWFLRQWRIGFVNDVISITTHIGAAEQAEYAEIREQSASLLKMYLDEYTVRSKISKLILQQFERVYDRASTYLSNLEHLLSLPIPQIQNFRYAFQPVAAVVQGFLKLETEWKEKTSQLIPYDPADGEVIMKFNNGFFWQNLNREYCRAEGSAMGHCGNFASYRDGDKVLSLRQLVKVGKDTYVRPSVTFILQKDGFLGEMKGRANNKPDKKYHPQIIALLRSPIVKGIRGGGYEAKKNFMISDLDPQTRDVLLDEKPELMTLRDYYMKNGMDQDVVAKLQQAFGLTTIPEGQSYAIVAFQKSLGPLIKDYGNRAAKETYDFMDDNSRSHQGERGDGDLIEEFLRGIDKTVLIKIGKYIQKNYSDAVDEYERDYKESFDPSGAGFVLTVLYDYIGGQSGSELWDDLVEVCKEAERVGVFEKMTDAMEDAIDGPVYGVGGVPLTIVFQNSNNTFDLNSPVYVTCELTDIVDVYDNHDVRDIVDEHGWLEENFVIEVHQPYGGFKGFDMNKAIELFSEKYPELSNDKD